MQHFILSSCGERYKTNMPYGVRDTLTGFEEVLKVVIGNWFNFLDMYALKAVEATIDWTQVPEQ